MPHDQQQSWMGLFELAAVVPSGWTLVGGQMVHLHCAERGVSPLRGTEDVDAVLDLRASPRIAARVTTALAGIGFEAAVGDPGGYETRWLRGGARIDVLVPGGLRPDSPARFSATGAPLQATPGAQGALGRSQVVVVDVAGTTAAVNRPDLVGALLLKAAAYTRVAVDPKRQRHLEDVAVLASLATSADVLPASLSRQEKTDLGNVLGVLRGSPQVWSTMDDPLEVLARVATLTR